MALRCLQRLLPVMVALCLIVGMSFILFLSSTTLPPPQTSNVGNYYAIQKQYLLPQGFCWPVWSDVETKAAAMDVNQTQFVLLLWSQGLGSKELEGIVRTCDNGFALCYSVFANNAYNRRLSYLVTFDRSRLFDADALLFHSRHINFSDLPPRLAGQAWVLVSLESPCSHKLCLFL